MDAVIPVVNNLASKNIQLTVPVRSTLYPLISASSQLLPNDEGGIDEAAEYLTYMARENQLHNDTQTLLLNALVKGSVATLDAVRSETLVQGDALYQEVKKSMDQFRNANPASEFTITEIELPTLLSSGLPEFQFIDSGSVLPRFNIEIGFGLRCHTLGTLVKEFLPTGSDDFNASLTTWLAQVNDKSIKNIVHDLFLHPVKSNYIDGLIPKMTIPDRLDYALLALLIISKLDAHVPKDVEMSNSEYTAQLDSLRKYFKVVANRSVKAFRSLIKSKRVVMSIKDNDITVLRATYHNYLNAGGSVEAVLGCLVEGKDGYTESRLLKEKEALEKGFTSNARVNALGNKHAFTATVRDAIINKGIELYNDTKTEEEMNIAAGGWDVPKLIKQRASKITTVTEDNVYDLCVDVIAECRYGYTDSSLIIGYMRDAQNEDSDLNVNELGLIALIEYMSDHAVSQIGVE